MISLNKLAYDVLNALRGGHSENTRVPSIRQIKHWILSYRAMLIRQAIQNGDIPNHFEQDLDNLPFEVVEYPDYGRFGMPPLEGRMLLRSTFQIPEPVRLKSGLPAFTYIGQPDLVENYELVDYHEAVWKNTYNRYTGVKPRATWFGNQIYVTNFPPEQISGGFEYPGDIVLTVRGIFEDPGAAYILTGWDYDDSSEFFPMPGDLAQKCVQSILGGAEVKMTMGIPNDVVLNNRPDGLTSIDNG